MNTDTNPPVKIQSAKTPKDILKTWEVISLLRPHLQKENFVSLLQEMFEGGYHLDFIEENGKAVAAIGYRHIQFLFNGKHIYIDDLTTLEASRGKGYGSQLLDHVAMLAKKDNYNVITLDSGTGEHRHAAYRLYFKKGFVIKSYHFSKNI